ncbi:TfuA-like protein [Saccharothrix tamanrassetensis]|nr:TfuA-like protein [Saccharothrix tamanrassetensis]
MVDGLYHHALGLRHKEYLHALDRGVSVVGAASMGALRALELSAFGMQGCGVIYRQYRAGIFDGDDAVAVAHEEDPPYRSLSVPIVNLHAAARAACAAGVLRAEQIADVMSALRAVYYPARTRAKVVDVLRKVGAPRFADWFHQHTADDPQAFDQKRLDCFSAIEAARGIIGAGARGHVIGGESGRWKTSFVRHWRNHFIGRAGAPPLAQRIAYQQIFNPDYRWVWERYLQETYARRGRPLLPGAALRVTDFIADRTGVDRFPPAPGGEDRFFDFLCPVPDFSDDREVELLLAGEAPSDVEAVSDHLGHGLAFADANPGPAGRRTRKVLSRHAAELLLSRIWGVPAEGLGGECRKRGIPDAGRATRLLQPFVVGVLKAGTHWRGETA